MNDKCLEMGTVQAFLDGETTPELSFTLTQHAAKCDDCALLLAKAEEENVLVFGALDRELNSLVPTQRLWNNISIALENEGTRVSIVEKLRALVFPLFASPSLTAAAGLIVAIGLFAFLWTRTPSNIDIADAGPNAAHLGSTVKSDNSSIASTSAEPSTSASTIEVEVRETNHSPETLKRMIVNAKHTAGRDRVRPQYLVEEYLPGEESYVRTIASLKQSVDRRKDIILDPSARIAYERDIAVVNDAIKRMKEIVKKDPKNQAAKQVLYSSYQNKIDLLNSVVDREELMAALQ